MAIALMKMFWKSMYMPSKINTILEREDVTLEEILLEDDVVEECKSGNSKLLDFLTKDNNLEKLVNMLVDEPGEEVEERFKYKNAHQACEVLTSDTTQITDSLSERRDLLDKIYSFFDHDPPINPLQASFFSKTMGLLITHKSEKMLSFFMSHHSFTTRLMEHLDTSAIADLLLRLVTCIDNVNCRNQCFQWLNEQQLVQQLVSLMDVSKSNEVHSNASQSICDIIRLSREHQYQHNQQRLQQLDCDNNGAVAPDDVLLRVIESSEIVNDLLTRALPNDTTMTNESLITSIITILQTLLEPRKTSATIFSIVEDAVLSESDELKENSVMPKNNNNRDTTERIVSCIVSRLQDFHEILNQPPKQRYNPMPSSLGLLDPPLGPSRLAVIRFFNVLLTLRNQSVETKLAQIDAPSKIISLFLEYPWNNFLHGEVEKFVFHALNSTSEQNQLLSKLVNECCLVDKLCDELEKYFKTSEQPAEEGAPPTTRPRRPGYLGHMTSMANLLVSKFNSSPNLLQEMSPETSTRWQDFCSTTLETINKINNTDLGVGISTGRGRLSSSEEDDEDDDFHNLITHDDLQKAFNNYQTQPMTTDFADSFGFNEDDFNDNEEAIGSPFRDRISSLDFNLDSVEDSPIAAASFHQACQDRIQQFDQSNSSEEEDEDDEESWPALRKQVPRLNLLSVLQKEEEMSKKKIESAASTSKAVSRPDNEEEEEDETRESELDDSEDDLDSPTIIRQTKELSRDLTSSNNGDTNHHGVTNHHGDEFEDDDDDYESLQDSNASMLDASFISDGGNDDDVKVNGTAHDDDDPLAEVDATTSSTTEVNEAGDAALKLSSSLCQVASKLNMIAGCAGDANDAESSVDVEIHNS